MKEFHNAIALVTGAGSGIGKATAKALASRGATVLCADINEPAAKETAAWINGHSFVVDTAKADSVAALAEEVHSRFGPLDILVNNAGVGLSGNMANTSLEDWEWIVGINLMGVVHGCHFFGPKMCDAGRGHVVNISSMLGPAVSPDQVAYGVTKAGVFDLTRSLRADWHKHGVSVSAICPGVIKTNIIKATRFVKGYEEAEVFAEKVFAHGHSPNKVANTVLKAIDTNSPMLPVGPEAYLGWFVNRLLPLRVSEVFSRTDVLAQIGKRLK